MTPSRETSESKIAAHPADSTFGRIKLASPLVACFKILIEINAGRLAVP
jgi:hypothetical protein